MNAKSIIEQKFDKGFNGYKMEEVDEFLREVSAEFSELEAQNESLEKKLEVLADKIREYRNDEEAIKEAILGAQKQSASVLASTDEKCKEMLAEAEEKTAAMLKEADENLAAKKEEAERIISEANAEKDRIEAECDRKSAELTNKLELEIKKYEAIIAKTRKESEDFTERLLSAYKAHIELIKEVPESCENEFVKQVSESYTEPAAYEEAPAEEAPVFEATEAEAPAEADLSDIEAVFAAPESSYDEPEAVSAESADEPFRPVFEEEETGNEEVNLDDTMPLDDDGLPFFNNKKVKRRSKYEKLDFGGNK